MSELARTGVSLEEDLLNEFDRLIAKRGYKNRSEAFRDLIREALLSETIDSNKPVVGTLTLVYDHHVPNLSEKLTETLGLIRARVMEQDTEFREQLAALTVERTSLRAEIAGFDDGSRLAHFDRIAGAKGTGLARAEGQQCSGCRMGIRPQVWNQLRDGLVTPCESCSRILYFDPALEAAPAPPKTAQSVVPGELGGSSVRRRQAGV